MRIKTSGKTGKTLPTDCDKGTDGLIDKSGLIKNFDDYQGLQIPTSQVYYDLSGYSPPGCDS